MSAYIPPRVLSIREEVGKLRSFTDCIVAGRGACDGCNGAWLGL